MFSPCGILPTMERDHRASDSEVSSLGLQVVTHEDGSLEPIFTVSDGNFADLQAIEDFYSDKIEQETKELKKLYAIMGIVTALQAIQIVKGVEDMINNNDYGSVLPITLVMGLMIYIRNAGLQPTKEKKKITSKKLEILQQYETNDLAVDK